MPPRSAAKKATQASKYDLSGNKYRTVLDLKKWGLPTTPVLGRNQHLNAQPPLSPHRHTDMEICYLVKGEQIFRVGKNECLLQGGDIYITYPGEIHDTARQPLGRGILYWLIIVLPDSPAQKPSFPPDDKPSRKSPSPSASPRASILPPPFENLQA